MFFRYPKTQKSAYFRRHRTYITWPLLAATCADHFQFGEADAIRIGLLAVSALRHHFVALVRCGVKGAEHRKVLQAKGQTTQRLGLGSLELLRSRLFRISR